MDPVQELLAAIQARDEEKARALLARHPGVARAPTPQGLPLLTMAIYARASRVIDALRDAGAEPTIHEAAALGDVARVRALAAQDKALVGAHSADGMTPLHLAAHFGQREAAVALLNLGADADAIGAAPLANAPLHAAAAGGQPALIDLLLSVGATPDARDAGGHTPLMVAAANGLVDGVRALLANGADARATNAQGKTPRDFAAERDEDEVVALLDEAAAAA